MSRKKQFIITKKVAKHGKQAVIVIPTILMNELKPGTLTQLTIDVLEDEEWEILTMFLVKDALHLNQKY